MFCLTSSTRNEDRRRIHSVAPSETVRYALCRVVVEDSVALLFSEVIDDKSADRNVRPYLPTLSRKRLNLIMTEAAMRGSIGSVAIWVRVLRACSSVRHDIPRSGMGPGGADTLAR
jgi:hypothetical protein